MGSLYGDRRCFHHIGAGKEKGEKKLDPLNLPLTLWMGPACGNAEAIPQSPSGRTSESEKNTQKEHTHEISPIWHTILFFLISQEGCGKVELVDKS